MWAVRVTIFQLDSRNWYQGRTQVGRVGITPPPWAWYFAKKLPAQKRLLFSHTFFLLICRLNANTTEWICMQSSRNIANGPKSNYRFWWESRLSSASRNHLTTFYRLFVHYACLRLCSVVVHFIRNNCLHFVCYGWTAQVLTALATLPISAAR